jgi:hypothetical protein
LFLPSSCHDTHEKDSKIFKALLNFCIIIGREEINGSNM